MKTLLISALKENGMMLDEAAITKLLDYLQLLTTWNKVFNLTNITDPHDMVYLHIIDSLSVQPYATGEHLLDVGSGAGLPGIPLAICHPEQTWVLLDKNSKKTRFQTQAIAELGLKNVKAAHTRSEEFRPTHGFDSILSRAFGTIRMFTETAGHLLAPTGKLVAMKGKYPAEELADLPSEFEVTTVQSLPIAGIDIERHIVCLSRRK